MTKQYDIEIVINGVAVMRRIIKNKCGIENEMFVAAHALADYARRTDNLPERIDAMISKGVKRK